MGETFVISDTHFGHAAMLGFKDDKGNPARTFASCEEMDQTMEDNWNSVVRPQDKVYHLGDVAIQKKFLSVVGRLNGKKSLVMGNHDIFDAVEYLKWFKNVRGVKVFDNHLFTHMPVVKAGRFIANVHGHTHLNEMEDSWYKNVCVEHTNYTPVPWHIVKEIIKESQLADG